MEMPVATSTRNNRALLYYVARSFVHLPVQVKFQIGFELNLVDHYDSMLSEDLLDEKIFKKVVKKDLIQDFMVKINKIRFAR